MLIAGPVLAAQPAGEGWKLEKDKDGVQLYERVATEDDSLREAYAETLVDQPPERILRVLRDYSTFPEWSPYTEETKLLRQDGPNVDLVFQRMDLPWPVGNRYYTMRLELKGPDAAGVFRIQWDLAPVADRQSCEDCGVEMPINRGVWILTPVEGGKTLLACQVLTDPGGSLPKFAFRAANERMFPKLIAATRDRAALERYATEVPK